MDTFKENRDNIVPLATFFVQLATLIAAAIVAGGALMQARTARQRHEEQTTADRKRRITESFAKAVEQLGSDKLETRLGGIYTLERISQESEREYWPIMETLTAFVRQNASRYSFDQLQVSARETKTRSSDACISVESVLWKVDEEKRRKDEEWRRPINFQPKTDIQAVLTVLGRRDEKARKGDAMVGRHLDLTATDLRGANLKRAHLEHADLSKALLVCACLKAAHLDDAILCAADLERADLRGASLVDANLGEANLPGAFLGGAVLSGAYLESASGLTRRQVNSAQLSEKTVLPDDLTGEAKPS